ncbi:hypothetical protein [Vibrio sp. SCSIO 43136]|uniref:hypothetical protein n=1 Tax=Vibrio sp. SCSIO 43136 TaxID=2819101 RepID=UPI002074D275|nr:hypothetical protein [Vibrio sp. SCSIO 43136]USD67769.1 hypothetical protein J4N39_16405 [Vibrio sp. SCSIO 43136]
MKRIFAAGLLGLTSMAVAADQHPQEMKKQDLYVYASYADHKLDDEKGKQYSVAFGGRNYWGEQRWFIGGELEVGFLEHDFTAYDISTTPYTSINVKGSDTYTGYLLGGKQFELSDSAQLNAYLIGGYGIFNLKVEKRDRVKSHGPKFGGGVDLMMSHLMLGVRYTYSTATSAEFLNDFAEKKIVGLVGYRF